MKQDKIHWTSKAIILMGFWLWEQEEYGHAMLCIHAPNWGYKIGHQLKLTWNDVIDSKTGKCHPEIDLSYVGHSRPIRTFAKENIEMAFKNLKIKDASEPIYKNWKTGKPLTSSTLNREMQRFSERFIDTMKEKTGTELYYKPFKSNAFEIAWAKDLTKANQYTPQIYRMLSQFMGHRTVKDTMELLEEEPDDLSTYFGFDLIKEESPIFQKDFLNDKEALSKFVSINLYLQID